MTDINLQGIPTVAQPMVGKVEVVENTGLAAKMAQAALPPPVKQYPKELVLEVESIDVSKNRFAFSVAIPNDVDFKEWGILQRAAVAKSDVNSPWYEQQLTTIINAIVYAERLGLSFEEGDVYVVEGKIAMTAKARRKRGLSSGKVLGFTVKTEELEDMKVQYVVRQTQQTWEGKNLKTTVTMKIDGWDEPLVYETTLKEWFKGSNPNWRDRPRYMLEENAIGHAMDRIVPAGFSTEEAPPQD